MKEKKQFFIPKNYDKKFEWIPGVSGWQHLAFVPIAAVDYLILQYTPFQFSNKIVTVIVSLALPWFLIGTHPIRENVPLWKHLYWKLRFLARQRQFKYRKEGYYAAIQIEEESNNYSISEQKGTEKERGNSKKISTRLDTDQRNRERVLNHSR